MDSKSILARKDVFVGAFLLLSWALIQFYLFSQSGVKTGSDSAFYLHSANELINLNFPEGRGIWYIGYTLFLAGFISLGVSLEVAIFVQILLSLIALILLYKTVKEISGEKTAGFMAAGMYVFWIKIHEWNVFLYTESLFTSCLIISFWLLLRAKKGKNLILILPFLAFTILIRPTGLGFFIAVVAFFLAEIIRQNKTRIFKWTAFIMFVSFSIFLIVYMLESYDLINSYSKAEIIYPNITLGIKPNNHLIIPEGNQLNVFKVVSFIYYNPIYFIKLCCIKFLLFFGNIKPYFSLTHNFLIIAFLYPTYFFAFKGYREIQNHPVKQFFKVYILFQGLTVMLTTENWDGRFLIPVLPFIFILSSISIKRCVDNFLLKYSNSF